MINLETKRHTNNGLVIIYNAAIKENLKILNDPIINLNNLYKLQNIDHSEVVSLQDNFDNAILALHIKSLKATNIKIMKSINKCKSDLKDSLPENTWRKLETFFHNTNTTCNKKVNAFVSSELNLARHVKTMNDENLNRYKYMLDELESMLKIFQMTFLRFHPLVRNLILPNDHL